MTVSARASARPRPSAEPILRRSLTDTDQLDRDYLATVDFLATKCLEVTLRVSWLPESKVVSSDGKEKMLGAVRGRKKGFSLSKRLFSAAHPLLKELNRARDQIEALRNSFTIVKAAGLTEDTVGRSTIAPGVRLIRADDVPAFEDQLRRKVDLLHAAASLFQTHMTQPYETAEKIWPPFLDLEKEEQGDEFDLRDYPEDIRETIKIAQPAYQDYKPSQLLPPEIYKRETERVRELLTGTVDTAIRYVADEITEAFIDLAGQLQNRIRLTPLKTHPDFTKLNTCEVVRQLREPNKPIRLELRRRDPDPDNPGKMKTNYLEYEVADEAAYQSLRPQQTNERKKITASTVENLREKLASIHRISDILGAPGENLRAAIDTAKAVLDKAGGFAAERLRTNEGFRKELHEALTESTGNILRAAETVSQTRRRISARPVDNIE